MTQRLISGLVARPGRFLLRPNCRALYTQLDTLARTGEFDVDALNGIRSHKLARATPELRYYLASLYLQINEAASARELLTNLPARACMIWYFSVLKFCCENTLALPRLSAEQTLCIDYLSRVIDNNPSSMARLVQEHAGFSVVGNAPGDGPVTHRGDYCSFYFNDYACNDRIVGEASVHVVTPSWEVSRKYVSESLCISGNNIFHRRSRVWQKFCGYNEYRSIYTFPRTLWASLSLELNASPSAGLLMLEYLNHAFKFQQLPIGVIDGLVAGFSEGVPVVNHQYNKEPASKRHNWEMESLIRKRCIDQLKRHCANLEWMQ